MNKEELIIEGKRLLDLVYSEEDSFFKNGTYNDVIPETEEANLEKWIRELNFFLVNAKNERIIDMIQSNLWIKNKRRVSKTRISNILDILSRFDEI